NQAVWPVIFDLTGPICARAAKSLHLLELCPRGHHDWPVKSANRRSAFRLPTDDPVYQCLPPIERGWSAVLPGLCRRSNVCMRNMERGRTSRTIVVLVGRLRRLWGVCACANALESTVTGRPDGRIVRPRRHRLGI